MNTLGNAYFPRRTPETQTGAKPKTNRHFHNNEANPSFDSIDATDRAHHYLNFMGARVAHQKSIVFSNNQTTRDHLRKHKWKASNATIKVAMSFRDLGAHVNMTQHATSSTLNQRMDTGTDAAHKVNR